MSTPAATAAPKLLSVVCSQASSGASMPGSAQGQGLGDVRNAQPGGAGLQGRTGHGNGAVPVGVGLDHGHDLGRRGRGGQPADVVPDGVQVDHGGPLVQRDPCPGAALNSPVAAG